MRLKFSTLLSGLMLILSAVSTRADLAFVLVPSVESGIGTGEVFFTGTLANSSLTDNLFLNNIQFSFTGAATNYLVADTNVFFANVPGILLPGEIYADVIFGIIINPAVPPGNYSGTATIQGGSDIFVVGDLTNRNFQVTLPPAALSVSISGTNLLLSWPSPPGGFVLQRNSDLTTTNWMSVTNPVTLTNWQNQIPLAPSAGNQFYRLEYP